MVIQRLSRAFFLLAFLSQAPIGLAQQAGGIRGMVYDQDFDAPLPEVQVFIAETGEAVRSTDEGNYVISQLEPGTYTLVFSKDGYARLVKANVVVSPGQMTELDAWLSGDFVEMEEFVVQDVQLGGATEIALLELRMESPALMDSISADLMSQAGVSDAASALRLVAGASIQDGKFAVIRGLPDRYVNSQMNGVRLPTADADKRAVQLDQFPSAIIDSIQVSKTFTPDQQGDASGGAVNVVLKGIPEETTFKVSSQYSYNNLVGGSDFITYDGGGVDFWGKDNRDIPKNGNFDKAVGITYDDVPTDYKWSIATGTKHEFDNDVKVGGFTSLFYERDSSFYDDGIDDKYWVRNPGDPMTPQFSQGSPEQGEFKTQLFDVTQGSEEVKWGILGMVGVETENHSLSLLNLYTRTTEDEATLAEDTRGKKFYFPDYNPDDPTDTGNQERTAAPYLRTETLQYTERSTHTIQLSGKHDPFDLNFKIGNFMKFLRPDIDWNVSHSVATLDQPDKRQFGSLYYAQSYNPGSPPYVPPSTLPEVQRPFKPAANFTLGNFQRIWKDITEESDQYFMNVKFPFEQWGGNEGYIKLGIFNDHVDREYNQDSFSNFNDNSARYEGPWEDLWSEVFYSEGHPVTAAEIDVDYDGEQDIKAYYYMVDFPLTSKLNLIAGARFEKTELSIINDPESEVTWIPPGAPGAVDLNPGDADVSFSQDDVLPSIGLVYKPFEKITLRGSYTETVARQTFKELSPIQQQEFLGGDVFIGNPELQMSALKNYDLRCDYTPYEGGLVSLSYFYKDIKEPIEYIQGVADFTYTTPVNYPEGELSGFEIEFRQKAGHLINELDGLTLGINGTFIDSEVTLPDDEAAIFEQENIQAPMDKRDMTNAPEHLYNFFLTYDMSAKDISDTQFGLFYTVRGDTLIAGAGQSDGNFVPNVYEKEYGTLNMSVTHKFSDRWSMKLQGKNLLDPDIKTVYRSEYIDKDVTKTSYNKGMEFSVGITATF